MKSYFYLLFRRKKQRATRIGILFTVFMILTASCKPENTGVNEAFNGTHAYQSVEVQMNFGARFPGSEGHTREQEWIKAGLEELDWRTEEQCFDKQGVRLCNVIGRSSYAQSDRPYLLLGAHYDTRRRADSDPFLPNDPVPGANDGASGVAVLLELARVIDPERLNYDLVLVFFDGEDQGHLDGWDWSQGARYMAEKLQELPAAVIIVDMVGDHDLQLYLERNSDPSLAGAIWSLAREEGFTGFIAEQKHAVIDDHIPFSQLGVPAVDIIDIEYPAWHTTRDTIDQISADSLYQVGRTLQLWLDAYGR